MGYNLKIIYSGSDRIEIYKIVDYEINTGFKSANKEGRRGKDDIPDDEKEINSKINRRNTLNEARNDIIRLIKCNEDMNTFITLTYASDREYKDSKKDLNNFFTKLRRDYKGLKYIWVLEFTKRNRIHFHLLTNIPIDIKLNTSKEKKSQEHKDLENNFRKKYWKHGFIDIRKLDDEGNTNIALYIAAYIVKDLIDKDLDGDRVYGYSKKTLNKPFTETYEDNREIETLLKDFKDDYQLIFCNSYRTGYITEEDEKIGTTLYFDFIRKNNDVEDNEND